MVPMTTLRVDAHLPHRVMYPRHPPARHLAHVHCCEHDHSHKLLAEEMLMQG